MKRKLIFIVALLLTVLTFTACMNKGNVIFDGDRVCNSDEYCLKFSRMTKTDTHELSMKETELLHCVWDIEKGEVSIIIAMDGEDPIYRGSHIDTADFLVAIPKDGSYKITIEAKNAAGVIDIRSDTAK